MSKKNTHIQALQAEARKRYVFNQAGQGVADIRIIGPIDDFWGYGVGMLNAQLSQGNYSRINVKIQSDGGDAVEALGIYNFLKGLEATVETQVIGFAASAATIVLMAGDRITMPENSFMMIHRPWSMPIGNADEIDNQVKALKAVEQQMINLYSSVITARQEGGEESVKAQVSEWLNAETWFSADEALAAGLIDAVTESLVFEPEQESEEVAFAMYNHIRDYEKVPQGLLNILPNEKNKPMAANKKSLIDQIRALLVVQEDAPAAPATKENNDPQPEQDLDSAREALEAAGFTITSPDDTTEQEEEEDALQDQIEQEEEEEKAAAEIEALRAEIETLNNTMKAMRPGTPSGGAAEQGEKKKLVNKERTQAFNGFAKQMLKDMGRGL